MALVLVRAKDVVVVDLELLVSDLVGEGDAVSVEAHALGNLLDRRRRDKELALAHAHVALQADELADRRHHAANLAAEITRVVTERVKQ